MSHFRGLFSILFLVLASSYVDAWNFGLYNRDSTIDRGEFPWLVNVVEGCGSFRGGGSLISNYVVLTAWKVVEDRNASQLTLQMGEWGMLKRRDLISDSVLPMEVRVRTIVRHPNFSHTSGANNLALLFLRKQVEFTSKLHPINLSTQASIRNLDLDRCIVRGLSTMTLPIVPTATCHQELRRWLGPFFQLHGNLLCAGGGIGRNICDDDGYPLVCPLATDPTQFQQVGIVNWHIDCGKNALPDVYTNVSLLHKWINQQIGLNPYVNEQADEDNEEQVECYNKGRLGGDYIDNTLFEVQ